MLIITLYSVLGKTNITPIRPQQSCGKKYQNLRLGGQKPTGKRIILGSHCNIIVGQICTELAKPK